jgi:hypothetical protein
LCAIEVRGLRQFDFGRLNDFDVSHSAGRVALRNSRSISASGRVRPVPASSSATRRATSVCQERSTPASSSRLAMRNSASRARTCVGS